MVFVSWPYKCDIILVDFVALLLSIAYPSVYSIPKSYWG